MTKRNFIVGSSFFVLASATVIILTSCKKDDGKLPKSSAFTAVDTLLSFDPTVIGQVSVPKKTVLVSSDLKNPVNVTVTPNFEVSKTNANSSYGSTAVFTVAELNQGDYQLYVRFTPAVTALGEIAGKLSFTSDDFSDVTINLMGTGRPMTLKYSTFRDQHLFFGGDDNPWGNQSSEQTFTLYDDMTMVDTIKMYVKLRCLTAACDPWDQFANVEVKDEHTDEWYEIGRYITPYRVDNSQLNRGFEIDVTDFKSLLTGSTELRAYIGVWGPNGWDLTVDFDYITGTPDYPYYAVSKVIQYAPGGVPYGVDLDASVYDLTKSVTIPANAESTHLRTIITGWGHATPADTDGRPCAEWCFRTHRIKINGNNTFEHNMKGIGCESNPVSPQGGNWEPDRAGWCPGMAVPVRVNEFSNPMPRNTFTFEYDYEDWTDDGENDKGANYATSVFVVVKSNAEIVKPTVN